MKKKDNQGATLVMVLVIVALLSILAISLSYLVVKRSQMNALNDKSQQVFYGADGIVEQMEVLLADAGAGCKEEADSKFKALADAMGESGDAFRSLYLSDGFFGYFRQGDKTEDIKCFLTDQEFIQLQSVNALLVTETFDGPDIYDAWTKDNIQLGMTNLELTYKALFGKLFYEASKNVLSDTSNYVIAGDITDLSVSSSDIEFSLSGEDGKLQYAIKAPIRYKEKNVASGINATVKVDALNWLVNGKPGLVGQGGDGVGTASFDMYGFTVYGENVNLGNGKAEIEGNVGARDTIYLEDAGEGEGKVTLENSSWLAQRIIIGSGIELKLEAGDDGDVAEMNAKHFVTGPDSRLLLEGHPVVNITGDGKGEGFAMFNGEIGNTSMVARGEEEKDAPVLLLNSAIFNRGVALKGYSVMDIQDYAWFLNNGEDPAGNDTSRRKDWVQLHDNSYFSARFVNENVSEADNEIPMNTLIDIYNENHGKSKVNQPLDAVNEDNYNEGNMFNLSGFSQVDVDHYFNIYSLRLEGTNQVYAGDINIANRLTTAQMYDVPYANGQKDEKLAGEETDMAPNNNAVGRTGTGSLIISEDEMNVGRIDYVSDAVIQAMNLYFHEDNKNNYPIERTEIYLADNQMSADTSLTVPLNLMDSSRILFGIYAQPDLVTMFNQKLLATNPGGGNSGVVYAYDDPDYEVIAFQYVDNYLCRNDYEEETGESTDIEAPDTVEETSGETQSQGQTESDTTEDETKETQTGDNQAQTISMTGPVDLPKTAQSVFGRILSQNTFPDNFPSPVKVTLEEAKKLYQSYSKNGDKLLDPVYDGNRYYQQALANKDKFYMHYTQNYENRDFAYNFPEVASWNPMDTAGKGGNQKEVVNYIKKNVTSFSSNTLAFVNTDKNAKIVLYDDAKTLANDLKIKFDSGASIFYYGGDGSYKQYTTEAEIDEAKSSQFNKDDGLFKHSGHRVYQDSNHVIYLYIGDEREGEEINSAGSHWDGKWEIQELEYIFLLTAGEVDGSKLKEDVELTGCIISDSLVDFGINGEISLESLEDAQEVRKLLDEITNTDKFYNSDNLDNILSQINYGVKDEFNPKFQPGTVDQAVATGISDWQRIQ